MFDVLTPVLLVLARCDVRVDSWVPRCTSVSFHLQKRGDHRLTYPGGLFGT
jgi:hypothetical protein